MARVSLPLARVSSSLLSYGYTLYGASIIAFGLGHLIFVIVWPYAAWREYYMARVIIFLGQGQLIFVIVRLYAVWREYYCLWRSYHIFVIVWLYAIWREYYMAQVLFPLARVPGGPWEVPGKSQGVPESHHDVPRVPWELLGAQRPSEGGM